MFVLRLMLVFTFYLRVGQGEICFPLPEFSSACRKNGKQKNSGKLVVSRPPSDSLLHLKAFLRDLTRCRRFFSSRSGIDLDFSAHQRWTEKILENLELFHQPPLTDEKKVDKWKCAARVFLFIFNNLLSLKNFPERGKLFRHVFTRPVLTQPAFCLLGWESEARRRRKNNW